MMRTTARRRGWGVLLLVAGSGVASCAELPDLDTGECGNAIIDPGEDCDRVAPTGSTCAAPEENNSCRFVCNEASICPTGHTCGVDGVCRTPSFTYAKVEPMPGAKGNAVRLGDFDADGRADILFERDDDSVEVLYFAGRTLSESAVVPAKATSGVGLGFVDDVLDKDATPALPIRAADIVVGSNAAIGAVLGSSSRDAYVTALPSYAFGKPVTIAALPVLSAIRPADAEPIRSDTQIEGVFSEVVNETYLFVKNPYNGSTPSVSYKRGTPYPFNPSSVVGPVTGAHFDEDPLRSCGELVVAASGEAFNGAVIVFTCDSAGSPNYDDSAATFRPGVPLTVNANAKVVAALVADVDPPPTVGLPHLDVVLVTENNGTWSSRVFRGNGDGTFGTDEALLPVPEEAGTRLLAIGDFNGDDRADYVLSSGAYFSQSEPGLASHYKAAFSQLAGWGEAAVVDMNADGYLDIVAVPDRDVGIEVQLGSASSYMNGVALPTNGIVSKLTRGDFDGDLIDDVVAKEDLDASAGSDCAVLDNIVALFGTTGGYPEDFRVVGRIPGVTQIVAGRLPRLDLRDSISDFGVASYCESDTTGRISIFYGTADRLLDAPFLLLDQVGANANESETGKVFPYTPEAFAVSRLDDPQRVVATLGRRKKVDSEAAQASLFVIDSSGGLFANKFVLRFTEQIFPVPTPGDPAAWNAYQPKLSTVTESEAQAGTVSLAELDGDDDPEVVVWVPGNAEANSRLYVFDNWRCAPEQTYATPAPECLNEDKSGLVNAYSITELELGEAMVAPKATLVFRDIDGDGIDEGFLTTINGSKSSLEVLRKREGGEGGVALKVSNTIEGAAAMTFADLADGPSLVYLTDQAELFAVPLAEFPKGAKALTSAPIASCNNCAKSLSLDYGDIDGDGLGDFAALSETGVVVLFGREALQGGDK